MPRILTNCPTTDRAVVTGCRTTDFDLATLAQTMSFRCSACNQVHSWTRETAWIEETLSLATVGAAPS
jgi:hypothetical protein